MKTPIVLFAALLLGSSVSSQWRSTAAAAVVDQTASIVRRAESLLVRGNEFGAAEAYREALFVAAELPSEQLSAWLPEAELALLRLEALRRNLGRGRDDLPMLEKWTARADAPFVAAVARRQLGFLLLSLGEEQRAAEVWAPLFHLRDWRVVGPFDNERGGGFGTSYGPEKGIDFSQTFHGKSRDVAWRDLPAAPLAGEVDLGALLDPREEALAYAVTFVESDSSQPAVLSFGTKNGYRIWVNGVEVASQDLQRPFRRDQNRAGIRLQEGWNVILFKLPQSEGAWRFAARLARPDGGPLTGAREARPPEGAPTAKPDESSEPPRLAPSPTERLAERLGDSPTDARGCYVLGSLLRARHAHDENDHPDTRRLSLAVTLEEAEPVYQIELARSERRSATMAAQEDRNAWRKAMETAFQLGSAEAAYRLAVHYSDQFDNRDRALDYLGTALERNPEFEDAIRLRGSIEDDLGFPRARQRAEEEIDALARPGVGARVRAAREAQERGQSEKAIEALRGILREDATQSTARLALVDLFQATGRDDDAVALLRSGARLEPFSTHWLLRLASHFEGRDRFDDALETVDEALRLRPDDARLHEKRAGLLRRLGNRSAALASLDEALRLRPNSPQIREYLEFLRTADDALEDVFRRDVTGIIDAARASGDEDDDDPARVLLELTAVDVNQDGTTKEFVQTVVRILNDRGVRLYDRVPVYYARGEQQVEFKKARVHHADGTSRDAPLERFGGTGGSRRSRASVDLPPLSRGDIVELEYVREDLEQSFFGDYYGHREVFQLGIPIAEKTFILRVPEGREFSFHQRGFDVEPTREEQLERGTVTYRWTARDIPKLDREPQMPPATEVSPVLEISTFNSWTAFCTWYWNLIRNQFESSPEIRRKVRELTSGAEDDLAKIRAIYNFIVSDIRYNAWEFGVHGFKPYNASTIFARRFGDCKDKATLMTVMLGEAGIPSHPVLIYGTRERAEEDLSLPLIGHFNHCITYVPARDGREGMFLDGTAENHRLEELPSMDRGAKVLVVTPDGGRLETVPWNTPDDLELNEETVVSIESDLSARMTTRVELSGDYAVYVRDAFEIEAQRKIELEKLYGRRFASSTVEENEFSDLRNLAEPVSFRVGVAVPRFVLEAPEGLALPPEKDFFGTSAQLSGAAALKERHFPVLVGNPRRSVLRTVYVLPDTLKVKALPDPQSTSTRFGSLMIRYTEKKPREIVVERRLEVTQPRIGTEEYADFREFATALEQLRDARVLLVRS